jgi:predicted secreted hydrolase
VRRGLVVSLVVLSLLPAWLRAGEGRVTYPPVLPTTELQLPRDEGSHPEYRLEWWYVTGWLRDDTNPDVPPRGFQVTFFRVRTGLGEGNPSTFAPTQVLFAHAALADPRHGRLRHAQRSARAGFELAYARERMLDVRLDDWSLRQTSAGSYRAVVQGDDFAFDLELRATQPPLLQGERGYSRKGPDPRAASHYYSQPHLSVTGDVTVAGRRERVAGEAWLDHEWSSDYVDERARGWDWMGINLEDGGALMAFRMRDAEGGGARWAGATLRSAAGESGTFAPADVEWVPRADWQSPRTGVRYPVRWRVRVGARTLLVEPLMHDAELDSRASTGTIYWEGPVRVRAEPDGREVGRGYLELTGYAGKLDL